MAPFNEVTDPLWKYGPVFSMFLSAGTLNTNLSRLCFVTWKRPRSPVSGHGFTIPSRLYILTAHVDSAMTPHATYFYKLDEALALQPLKDYGYSPGETRPSVKVSPSVRSKAPIASARLSKVTGSGDRRKGFLKFIHVAGRGYQLGNYCSSCDAMAISTGFSIDSFACSSTLAVRPSQN